jgi:hypothetical protein
MGGVFFVMIIQKENISLKSKSLNDNSKFCVPICDCIKDEFANFLRCQFDLSSNAWILIVFSDSQSSHPL